MTQWSICNNEREHKSCDEMFENKDISRGTRILLLDQTENTQLETQHQLLLPEVARPRRRRGRRSRWRHLGTPRLPAGGPCRSPARWQDGASPHQVGDLDSKPDVACGFDSLGTSLPWSRCNPCGKRGCRAGAPDEVNSSTMCSHRVAIKGHECGAVELLRVLVLVHRAT